MYREYDEKTGELIKLECSKCHKIKTTDSFCKDKSKKDGVQTKCRQCDNERSRKWRENNPEHNRQWCESHKKERYEYYCKYHENHKEEIRQYRENHKEKMRQYCENHKEEKREYDQQRRENKTQQEIMKIYENVTKRLYPHEGIQYGVIYGVICNDTNRWYIGQTTTSFNTRYNGNFFKYKHYELVEDNEKGKLLAEDIEKYGQESFEIIEVLDVAFSEKELDEKEAYYIDLYKAYDEGYNSTRGNIFKHGKEKRMCCCE